MERGGGLLTCADLRRYEAKWRPPVSFNYRGHQICGMPPSSGGITMAIIGNILNAYDLGELGWHAPRSLHLQAEAMRRAFAARNHFLGDPDFVEIPRRRLASDKYAEQLRASISKEAMPSKNVSPETGRDSQPTMHTTHFSIVDNQGNAVALTTTNFLYGEGCGLRAEQRDERLYRQAG